MGGQGGGKTSGMARQIAIDACDDDCAAVVAAPKGPLAELVLGADPGAPHRLLHRPRPPRDRLQPAFDRRLPWHPSQRLPRRPDRGKPARRDPGPLRRPAASGGHRRLCRRAPPDRLGGLPHAQPRRRLLPRMGASKARPDPTGTPETAGPRSGGARGASTRTSERRAPPRRLARDLQGPQTRGAGRGDHVVSAPPPRLRPTVSSSPAECAAFPQKQHACAVALAPAFLPLGRISV
jgi:hypothetical protein